jgi:hypothetical protein
MNALQVHFGMGDATTADELVVEWPSGARQTLTGIPADGRIRVVESGTTAVEVSLARRIVEPGHVRLEWLVSSSTARVLAVERSDGAADWHPIAHPSPDGTGLVTLDDRDVRPGERYSYRLLVRDESGDRRLGEVVVVVPAPMTLALHPTRANPTPGPVRVSFELPNDPALEPAHFELLDAAGRRLDRVVYAGAAGRVGELELAGSRPLPVGVYLVRLTQGERVATTKVAIVR